MNRKRIILLGATGSIGKSTLDVIKAHPESFELAAISSHVREPDLLKLSEVFEVDSIALSGKSSGASKIKFFGPSGLLDLVRDVDADIVLNGIAGSPGLAPSMASLEAGKDLALANKETLVMAGALVKTIAAKCNQKILPVDSEHAALFELCNKADPATITSLILTASGGAFREYPISKLEAVTWQDALAHPTWDMGKKITIDSASMANKGLEVIEACELFDIPEDKVQVVIHPQSCVHGMISTRDGSFYAQLSRPDMRIPIQNALSYPEMLDYPEEKLTFDNMTLDFMKPDSERYPCLELAREAARKGGPYCLAYNAANEVAVEAFIGESIRFTQIPQVISSCLDGDWGNLLGSLEQILDLDQQVRSRATSMIQEIAK